MATTQTNLNWQEVASFTAKQRAAMEAVYTHRYILYGGARGGGKSRLLRWALVEFLVDLFLEYGLKNVRVGLFCETYPDLKDRQISKIKSEFPLWMGKTKDTKEDGFCFFLDDSMGGGVIALRNLDQPEKYQSSEFAAIAVDELTKTTKDTFDVLRGSLRWPGVDHTVFIAATNPGGIGHLWVKQLWLDRDFPPEMRDMADQFIFIKSLPEDNPHLSQTYWDDLNSLPNDLRRAWVEGDWNVFAGQAFGKWRNERHIVKPFETPASWPKWRAIDWGSSAPFCCLWLARNPDNGRQYVYREVYQAGLSDRQQARVILDYTDKRENISFTYADPSMWTPRTLDDIATSTADVYAANGVILTRGDNDRLSGKRKVERLLEDLPDGVPGLQIFETCKNLIRTLPALPYDKKRIEDIDTDAEDHAYDALKYSQTSTREYRPPSNVQTWEPPLKGLKML